MKRHFALVIAVLIVLVGASGAAASSLTLSARIAIKWAVADCPPGTPSTSDCYSALGRQTVRGIGSAQLDLFDIVDRSDPANQCERWSYTGSLAAGSKGSVAFTGSSDGCIAWHRAVGNTSFHVTGGNGVLSGASGSGSLDFVGFADPAFTGTVELSGTLTAPSYTFDTTAPTVEGAVNKSVRAPRSAPRVRVRFAVTAHDAVDGKVRVRCNPHSGSFFKPGRTKVSCSATDSSGNAARRKFTVTVKRS